MVNSASLIWSMPYNDCLCVPFFVSEVQISPLTSVETVTEGGTATVCIGVSLGSLQTVVQVNVRTITSVASTGRSVSWAPSRHETV